jgi:hypothetical protein
VADEPRQPVAIRVSRPYASEDEFLEHELETLTRTSVTLVGSQSRPQGVILRFEIALANGVALLRGEGRVVGYKLNAYGDLPGLTLRFTRLDTKSKALVDRAATMREARARAAFDASVTDSVRPPAPEPEAAPAPPPLPPPPPAPVWAPPPVSVSVVESESRSSALVDSPLASLMDSPLASLVDSPLASLVRDSVPVPPLTSVDVEPLSIEPLAIAPLSAAPRSSRHSEAPHSSPPVSLASLEAPSSTRAVARPGNREPLLDKLRARGKSLSPDKVARILTKRSP